MFLYSVLVRLNEVVLIIKISSENCWAAKNVMMVTKYFCCFKERKDCYLWFAILLVAPSCSAFYVPGVAPVEFKNGSKIEVKAVKLTSMMTQLPYEYYSLPFCMPKNGTLVYKSENLGKSPVFIIMSTISKNLMVMKCYLN